ncbi:hypothetical protein LRS56_02520 [Pseudomonas poae]|nr:hypothetical protein LRS56_02520 [Pseudomonas poae]
MAAQQSACRTSIELDYDDLPIARYSVWHSKSKKPLARVHDSSGSCSFYKVVETSAEWSVETLLFFKAIHIDPETCMDSKLSAALLDQSIKWTMALFPQCCDRLAFEYAAIVNFAVALCESRGSDITLQNVVARDVEVLGVPVDFALDYVLKPLNAKQTTKFKDEFYWALYIILGKQAERPTPYYLAWCNELGSSYERYIQLRNIDGQFGLAVVFYGCLIERQSLTIDMARLSEAVEATILIHDCTTITKHVAEKEICNILNFVPQGRKALGNLLVRAGNIYNDLHNRPISSPWEWMYAGSIQAMWMLRANNPRYPFLDDLCRAIGPQDAEPPPIETLTWYEPSEAMVKTKLI